jgi:hypothetical protein
MSTQTTATKPDAWPAGVIARYPNQSGATVDITDQPAAVGVICRGCPAHTQDWPLRGNPAGHHGYTRRDALEAAQKQAQGHAETCRALPRPTT